MLLINIKELQEQFKINITENEILLIAQPFEVKYFIYSLKEKQ